MGTIKPYHAERRKILQDHTLKYVYYLLALGVGAIAFIGNKALDLPVGTKVLSLGISAFFWIASVYYGLRYVWLFIESGKLEDRYLTVEQGVEEGFEKDLDFDKFHNEIILLTNANGVKITKCRIWQTINFFLAILFYVNWVVAFVYLKSHSHLPWWLF